MIHVWRCKGKMILRKARMKRNYFALETGHYMLFKANKILEASSLENNIVFPDQCIT
jgi:hypothetical protein